MASTHLLPFIRQVGPLTAYQSVKSIYIVGISLGGGIVLKFTELYPHLVKKLVMVCTGVAAQSLFVNALCRLDKTLLPGSCLPLTHPRAISPSPRSLNSLAELQVAPVGLPVPVPIAAKFLFMSGVGEMLLGMMGKKLLTQHLDRGYATLPHPDTQAHMEQTARNTLEWIDNHPMFLKSLLSTGRNFDFGGLADSFAAVDTRDSVAKLLVWGTEDIVVPFGNNEAARKLMPSAEWFPMEGAGHTDCFGHGDTERKFYDRLLAFLVGGRSGVASSEGGEGPAAEYE